MKLVLILLLTSFFCAKVVAQIDTLKFIDGSFYVLEEGRLIYPDLNVGNFKIVEQGAEFPGGRQNLDKWISENLKIDTTLSADVIVKAIFTISTKGLPTAIVVQGDTINGRGKRVVKLIETMPRWKPALQHGKAVKMRLALPITFSKIEKQKK